MKHFDPVSATFSEAKQHRTTVIEKLEKGTKQEKARAKLIRLCKKGSRCGIADCPVCRRVNFKKAKTDASSPDRAVLDVASEDMRLDDHELALGNEILALWHCAGRNVRRWFVHKVNKQTFA